MKKPDDEVDRDFRKRMARYKDEIITEWLWYLGVCGWGIGVLALGVALALWLMR